MPSIDYTYPDDTRGSARTFVNGASVIPASYLAQRAEESDAGWSDRLAAVGIKAIYRITPSTADPNLYDAGDPVEAVTDGVTDVTYPDPVAKVPVWSTSTREVMYISTGADVPTGYTALEPPHAVYAVWDDGAWAVDIGSATAAKQAEIVSGAQAAMGDLPKAERYGEYERATWTTQTEEAKAYIADPDNADTPMLSAMVAKSGEDIAALAAEIVANATAWPVLSGNIVGQRQALNARLSAAVESGTDAEKLAAILAVEVVYVDPAA